MKLKPLLLYTIIAFTAFTTPLAAAKWHFHGGPVFDAKRFADSVKETAEMVNNVNNAIKALSSLTFKNAITNLDTFVNNFDRVSQEIEILKNGDSIITLNKSPKDMENFKLLSVTEAIGKDGPEHKKKIFEEASLRHKEIMTATLNITDNNSTRLQQASQLISRHSEGELAQKQINNSIALVSTMNEIDAAKLKAVAMVNTLQQDEDTLANKRVEEEAKKQLAVKSYDPFNQNQLDKANLKKVASPSKNLGFIPFGKK